MSHWLRIEAYDLEPGQQVGCYFCMQDGNHASYGRGEAFLADAAHSPCDGNANYVCNAHLDPETVVVDVWSPSPEPE